MIRGHYRTVRRELRIRRRLAKRLHKIWQADIVVVSHAKSGRTWLATMISHVYHQKYGIDEKKIIKFDNLHKLCKDIPKIYFTHDNRKFPDGQALAPVWLYARSRVILLLRDPRDVAVSWYFHGQRKLRLGRRKRPTGAIYDFVIHTGLPGVLGFMERWAGHLERLDRCLVVRYEALRAHPEEELARVMAFIGGDFGPEIIDKAVELATFERLREREQSGFFESDRLHPGKAAEPETFKVRRGKVGGYRDYFTAEELARIEAMIDRPFVAQLGYRPAPVRPQPEPVGDDHPAA